jgi:hypothetical protein
VTIDPKASHSYLRIFWVSPSHIGTRPTSELPQSSYLEHKSSTVCLTVLVLKKRAYAKASTIHPGRNREWEEDIKVTLSHGVREEVTGIPTHEHKTSQDGERGRGNLGEEYVGNENANAGADRGESNNP